MDTRKILAGALALLTLFGLFTGLLYAINLDLSSDSVVPGLVAMEIVNHQNFQFFYPSNDPYLFTDIFTFFFIPQVLSGFNPVALRLTAYVMFLLVAGIFSYIIYRYAGTVNALIFTALLANLSPVAYDYFITPELHVGTLIGAGILLILFEVDRVKTKPYTRVLAYGIIAALIVLSDSLLIALFVVPFVIYHVYCYLYKKPEIPEIKNKKETVRASLKHQQDRSRMNVVVLSMVALSAFAWFFKTYCAGLTFPPLFQVMPIKIAASGTAIGVKFSTFFTSLALLLNENLMNVVQAQFGLFDIVVVILLAGLIGYSFIYRNKKAGYLYFMFGVSAIILFAAFLFSDYADGLWSARFLTYIAVSVFAVIALAYRDTDLVRNINTLFVAGIILLILSTIPASIQAISGLDYQPNKEDYDFIHYLKDNNLTLGISDYNNANKLTYLSHEDVRIRQVQIEEGHVRPYYMLSAVRWYQEVDSNQDTVALIVCKNDSIYDKEMLMVSRNPGEQQYYYGKYSIYDDNLFSN